MLLDISNDSIVFPSNPHQVTSNSNTPFIPQSLTPIPNSPTKALERKVPRVLSRPKVTPENYSFNIYSVRVTTFKLIVKRTRQEGI